jgi:hypothetical protein
MTKSIIDNATTPIAMNNNKKDGDSTPETFFDMMGIGREEEREKFRNWKQNVQVTPRIVFVPKISNSSEG